MSCPHTIKPGPCSQCLGARPRRITHDGEQLLIDGQPTGRTLDREQQTSRVEYGRRGGRAQKRGGAL